jgi:hypothetical protein
MNPNRTTRSLGAITAALVLVLAGLRADGICAAAATQPTTKPVVAIFPLAGSGTAANRTAIGFSMRQKLARDGMYNPIDGYTMSDIASAATSPVTYDTPLATVKDLASDSNPSIIIWGNLDASGRSIGMLRLRIADLRTSDPLPRAVQQTIAQETDTRFVVENILQTIPGVTPFEHPSETAVIHDAESDKLWASNPNLIPDGDFTASSPWQVMLETQLYAPPILTQSPPVDHVGIVRHAAAGGVLRNVLVMNLSRTTAENNGFACLSGRIPIQPNTRYRMQFSYQSDGPVTHVFVKGYIAPPNPRPGEVPEQEVYRRQVPPGESTGGKWVTVVDDMNPQNPNSKVEFLRVDLYAYLKPGLISFDDIQVRAVGSQTHTVHDDALRPLPTTQPAGR